MSLLDVVLFTVPGLMAYFWIEKFGITPSVKPSNLEQTAIGAILWLPTFLLSLVGLHLIGRNLPTIKDSAISTDQAESLAWFLLFSILSSFIISVVWSLIFYRVFLIVVNSIRKVLGKGELSHLTTVWEDMFVSGKGMVIRINKLGSTEAPIVGQIDSSSRPLSGEQSLILTEQPFWKEVLSKGEVRVEYSFINTDKGILIEKLSDIDLKEILKNNVDLLLLPTTSRRKRR